MYEILSGIDFDSLGYYSLYVIMNPYFENLKAHNEANPPNFGDGESALTVLYACHTYDNEQIKKDFNELYRLMNAALILSGIFREYFCWNSS